MQLTGGIAGLRQLADCGVFERRHAGSPVRGLDYRLRPWEPADRDAVIALITGIQRGEFRFPITTSDQPGPVIGGHDRRHENRRGHRRTTRVNSAARAGSQRGLLQTLVGWTEDRGIRTIFLGTTAVMGAAHRFYEKHRFLPIDLPRSWRCPGHGDHRSDRAGSPDVAGVSAPEHRPQ